MARWQALSPHCSQQAQSFEDRSSATTAILLEDVRFISDRLSVLLHAVQDASDCEGIAKAHGANEAERRHEWDALLVNFFQPCQGQRDILCVCLLLKPFFFQQVM